MGISTVLLAALLLEACADDTPVAPAEDAPTLAMMPDDSTNVVIEPHWLTLDTIGVTDTLIATVLDADGDTVDDASVTWESADTTIATVDTAGVVTSVDFGKTKVTATYDSVTAYATVEVSEPLTDREILEIFYEATGGRDWDEDENWLSDEDLDDWYGVQAERGKVEGLFLYDNNLVGTIPRELGGLDELFQLDLAHNRLLGPIPPELSKFRDLRDLLLDENAGITGSLPPELGHTGGLEYFMVDGTDLSGPVPLTFANLDLTRFYFDKDGVCIPAALEAWLDSIPEKKEDYQLCTDKIVIDPDSLYLEVHAPGDTARLAAAVISAEGDTVPDAEITWSSADTAIARVETATGLVTTVDYGTALITATSDSLADTARVEIVFKLSNRQVLDTLFRVTGGENWTDTTNWLSDEPLSEWYGVETSDSGEVIGLSLGDNNLTGSIPGVLAELDSLVTLDLRGNALGGEIPWGLRELLLRDLLLNGNALEGRLPRSLGEMAGLRYLDIGDNKLSGVVPREFSRLELDTLYAAGSGVCVPPSLNEWFEGIEQTDSAARCVASITVTVVDLPSLTFYAPGETGDLSATYVSAEGDTTSDVSATWSSGDTAVVSVDAAGRVTAVGSGETEITAIYDSIAGTIAAVVDLPENDRDVLEILYDRARGQGWTDATNWLTDEPLSEWAGVETDDSGRVVKLTLRNNNLRGPLHSSIGLLDRLVTLDLSRNWVSGPILAEVGDLEMLQDLTLSVNGFVGGLPSALGTLDSLRNVNVAATSLSGLVPASFADLELESFLVSSTGVCIPPSLAEWLDSIAETDDPPECASRVVVEPASLTFDARGDTATLSATVIDAEGDVVEDAEVTWKSADTRVARVNTGGRVTARSSGVTEVTATYDRVTRRGAEVAVRLPGRDRVALEAFYRATGGADWEDNTNWLSDEPLGEWYGVDTYGNGRIEYLELEDNNLTGQIPAAIGLLDTLFVLDLSDNDIAGPIPSAIGRLQRLRNLNLRNTGLDGPLPSEMGNMTGLEDMDLDDTGFSGPLPETFTDLTLRKFYHDGTDLCVPRSLMEWYESTGNTDPLPCIPETPDRDVLVTIYNATGGPEWGRNRNWLSDKSLNTWYGIVTDEAGYVTEIELDANNLAGPIPPELGSLSRLEVLGLSDNRLSGSLPPELGNLPLVEDFGVKNNNLSGSIPPELGELMSNLKLFDAGLNRFSGPIPAEFGKLVNLEELRLSESGVSGPIPPELGNLKKLRNLWASANELEGPIPAELGNLESLKGLSLHTNQLEGPIPPELGKLSNLEYLWLGFNQITGPIPAELGNLKALEDLNLDFNQVDGAIPPELGDLTSLEWLVLRGNQLSGRIPPELGKLSNLEYLWLYENKLSGTIPLELGDLSGLRDFWLGDNHLSRAIPPEIGNLANLERFSVSNNPDLEGLMPRSMMNLPLGYLNIEGTDLCPQLDDEFQKWLDGIGKRYGLMCPTTQIERFALVELYDSTGGYDWTNSDGWDTDSDVGEWYGVTVEDSLVRELRLRGNGLEGPLPPALGSLSGLETLDLADNDLTGGVVVTITSIDPLDTIRVSDNEDMEGPLPFRMTHLENLSALEYEDTDMCASPAPTFQAWIDSLDVAKGATCGNPDSVKLSLPVVYLTQAIQRPEGDVPLISNRKALLRVFLVGDQENAFFEPAVFATFTRDGEEDFRVVMPSEQDRVPTFADEGSLLKSYNAEIPAKVVRDNTEFVIAADSAGVIPRAEGSRTRFPETGTVRLDVIEVPPFELTVVPVLYADKPDSSIFEWTDNVDDDSEEVSLFKYSFPFGRFTATSWDTAYVTSLDMTDEDNTWSVLLEVEQVYRSAEATGYWYAVADADDGYVRGIARLNGWVSFGKPWATELAHEVGHTLNLRHAPCGGARNTDPDFPYDHGSIGMWGYDFRDSSLVSPKSRRDIMGYCYDKGWLSDYYFDKVIRLREKKEGEDPQEGSRSRVQGQMLVLWGGVLNGELRIEPVHSMRTTATLPDQAGPYRLDGITSGGDVEFSLSFTPGEDVYGNKYFLFAIPIEEDWEDSLERITLTGPEGEVGVDNSDPRSLTVVTDPTTGRIRAILRDWVGPLPAALGDTSGLEVETTRGILEAVRLR